jgi:hypothetical protein
MIEGSTDASSVSAGSVRFTARGAKHSMPDLQEKKPVRAPNAGTRTARSAFDAFEGGSGLAVDGLGHRFHLSASYP